MIKSACLVVFVVLFFSVLGVTFGQSACPTDFGIGVQAAFHSFGISGILDVANKVSIQAILGFFGDLKSYGGRLLYRFNKEEFWNVYGFGMLGAWSYTGLSTGANLSRSTTTETVFGFGAGAGVEYNLEGLTHKFIPFFPLYINLEIGFGAVNFKQVAYNFSPLMVGAGVHFRI